MFSRIFRGAWRHNKVTREKDNDLKNIPHEEVFRGCTIIGIVFDSCIAQRYKQIDMRSCLSEASSSNNYDNRTSGLRARTFSDHYLFRPFRPTNGPSQLI